MFSPWPDISALYLVRRDLKKLSELEVNPHPLPIVTYRGKVKLDGTNASVRIEPDGILQAQSRTTDIFPGKTDNSGFAAWTESTRDFWLSIFNNWPETVNVYGEWCGKGIQKGTSVSCVNDKLFVIFSIQRGDIVFTEPEVITALLNSGSLNIEIPSNVHVLPWYGEPVTIDFSSQESVESIANGINETVLTVESCDPWVRDTFGIEGIGEGLVYYPIIDNSPSVNRHVMSRLMFKAKGEKHRVKAAKVAVEVDTSLLESVDAFVAMFVTEPRLQQALDVACGGDASPQNTGKFLGWISQDVLKEGKAELETNGLDWKKVNQSVQLVARTWFKSRT